MIHLVPSDISKPQGRCHQNRQLAESYFILCHDCKAMIMCKGCPQKSYATGYHYRSICLPKSIEPFDILFCLAMTAAPEEHHEGVGLTTDPVHHLPAPGECLRVSQNSNKCLYLGKKTLHNFTASQQNH